MIDPNPTSGRKPHRVGIAANHGGFELKQYLLGTLREAGYHLTDFGDHQRPPDDDDPDFVVPLAQAIAAGAVDRGIALGGRGAGTSLAANRVTGVRAGLVDESFPDRRGVDGESLNLICLVGLAAGRALALERVQAFLAAGGCGAGSHRRHGAKVAAVADPSQGARA
jgi:ribose 5-phosphate isomerase B